MGLSISASAAIIFIASVIVFGTLLGAFDSVQTSYLDAQRDAQDRTNDIMNTKIAITTLDLANGTLTIVNKGETTLAASEVNILIDGKLADDRVSSREVYGNIGSDLWMPGETLILTLSGNLTDASFMVVCGNGVTAYL